MPSLLKKNNSYLSKRRLSKGGSVRNTLRRLFKSKTKNKSKSKTGTVASRQSVAEHTRARRQTVTNQLRRLEERNQVRRTQGRRTPRLT